MLPDTSAVGSPSKSESGTNEAMAEKERPLTSPVGKVEATDAIPLVSTNGAAADTIAPHTTIWRTITRRAFGAPRIIQRNHSPVIASENTTALPTSASWRSSGLVGSSAAGQPIDRASAAGIHRSAGARHLSGGIRIGIGASTMAQVYSENALSHPCWAHGPPPHSALDRPQS